MPEQTVTIQNKLGLHARASARLATTASAASACGPSVRMVICEPLPAASIMMPMMLLPLTSTPSLEIQTSQS